MAIITKAKLAKLVEKLHPLKISKLQGELVDKPFHFSESTTGAFRWSPSAGVQGSVGGTESIQNGVNTLVGLHSRSRPMGVLFRRTTEFRAQVPRGDVCCSGISFENPLMMRLKQGSIKPLPVEAEVVKKDIRTRKFDYCSVVYTHPGSCLFKKFSVQGRIEMCSYLVLTLSFLKEKEIVLVEIPPESGKHSCKGSLLVVGCDKNLAHKRFQEQIKYAFSLMFGRHVDLLGHVTWKSGSPEQFELGRSLVNVEQGPLLLVGV